MVLVQTDHPARSRRHESHQGTCLVVSFLVFVHIRAFGFRGYLRFFSDRSVCDQDISVIGHLDDARRESADIRHQGFALADPILFDKAVGEGVRPLGIGCTVTIDNLVTSEMQLVLTE